MILLNWRRVSEMTYDGENDGRIYRVARGRMTAPFGAWDPDGRRLTWEPEHGSPGDLETAKFLCEWDANSRCLEITKLIRLIDMRSAFEHWRGPYFDRIEAIRNEIEHLAQQREAELRLCALSGVPF